MTNETAAKPSVYRAKIASNNCYFLQRIIRCHFKFCTTPLVFTDWCISIFYGGTEIVVHKENLGQFFNRAGRVGSRAGLETIQLFLTFIDVDL